MPDAPSHEDVLAHSKTKRALLLLITQVGQMRIEQVMGLVALPGRHNLTTSTSISGKAYPVLAPSAPRSISKSRNRPPLPVRIAMWRIEPSRSKPRRAVIFSSPGQSSCLSMTQDSFSATIRRITAGAITTDKRERVVLQNERHVRADRLGRLTVVSHDLVVGPQGIRRTDHDARGADSITSRARDRMAAKPGADTPTMMGTLARLMMCFAIAIDSLWSSLGASPS